MASPQQDIFIEGSSHHYYLEFSFDRDCEAQTIQRAVRDINQGKQDAVHQVIAFGPEIWSKISAGQALPGFTAFKQIDGVQGYSCPSTQRDILIWLHGNELDNVFDQALNIQRIMFEAGTLELDERGFTYHDSRDLIGFVDGSANPQDEEATAAALIPTGSEGEGGSFVLTQKWVHDLEAFLKLPVPEQEAIIGRTKPGSIELEGDAMPNNSHVSRTDLSENGEAMKIYRRSSPFGSVSEKGLYFLAFSCAIRRFEIQLHHMFGVTDDGIHDRLIEYSKPVTSAYWFAPSKDTLAAF